jgi:signal transduction histidine kinase
VSAWSLDLDTRCALALRAHLDAGDERTRHQAYELGRSALADGIGVLDLALVLWRVLLKELPARGDGLWNARRTESFLLEILSPFEMAHRGAREASAALRTLDERREEQVRRIARELHDQAGQLLATVYLSLEGLRAHLAPGAGEHLDHVTGLLGQVEDEIRRVAHELRPAILDDLGLIPALRFLGEGVSQRSGIAVAVKGSAGGRLPRRIETELYRTIQEALNNVARHSHASRATIDVRNSGAEVRCSVCDDGRGFATTSAPAPGVPRGLGLAGIRERLAPLGGALEIRSRPGAGTELTIRIPIEVPHANPSAARG